MENENKKAEARRLRKKLRDIDRLVTTDSRTLNADEADKLSRKAEYEERLRALQSSGESPVDEENETVDPTDATSSSPRPKKQCIFPSWTQLTFDVSNFEAHSETIKAVTSYYNGATSPANVCYFLSTSNDTTARLWQFFPKTVEVITADSAETMIFNGHKAVVTCAVVVDGRRWFSADFLSSLGKQDEEVGNHFLLTSSTDCNICIWCLKTGKELLRQYTYQPVTQLAVVDVDLVLTGTEHGKLELWNLLERSSIYSSLFDRNAKEIRWISRIDESGLIVACSRGDRLGIFQLTPDPLVGTMIQQCYCSDDLKTTRGEDYVLRKVTGVVGHEDRIYLTTLNRPSIKSLSWDLGSLKIARFAGRHFPNGSFLSLKIWSQPNYNEPSYLFALEANYASEGGKFAVHIHSLPHDNYALSNYYVGSILVPLDDFNLEDFSSLLVPSVFDMSVGAMKLERIDEEGDKNQSFISPCILCSIRNSFLVLVPNIYPPTVSNASKNDSHTSKPDVEVTISQIELHPKPSVVNLSMTQPSDVSDERSDQMTSDEGTTGVADIVIVKTPYGVKTAKRGDAAARCDDPDDDNNPPTDVDDDDGDGTAVDQHNQIAPARWGAEWRNMCNIL